MIVPSTWQSAWGRTEYLTELRDISFEWINNAKPWDTMVLIFKQDQKKWTRFAFVNINDILPSNKTE